MCGKEEEVPSQKRDNKQKRPLIWPYICTYDWIDHVCASVKMYECVLLRHKEFTWLFRRIVSQITSLLPENLLFHLYLCTSTFSRKELLILGFPYLILSLPLPWHSVSSQKQHSEILQHPSGNGYPLGFLPLSFLVHISFLEMIPRLTFISKENDTFWADSLGEWRRSSSLSTTERPEGERFC